MHVSRGVSGEAPIRLNCRPELSRLVLQTVRSGSAPIQLNRGDAETQMRKNLGKETKKRCLPAIQLPHFSAPRLRVSAVKSTRKIGLTRAITDFQVSMDARFGYISTSPTNYNLDE